MSIFVDEKFFSQPEHEGFSPGRRARLILPLGRWRGNCATIADVIILRWSGRLNSSRAV
jgi:hypothetical protein